MQAKAGREMNPGRFLLNKETKRHMEAAGRCCDRMAIVCYDDMGKGKLKKEGGNEMRKKAALILSVILALSLAGCGIGETKLRFGTGGIGGIYYAYGSVLGTLTEENLDGVDVEVKTTAGSAANLRLLKDGYLQMAIIQNDALYDAIQGEDEFEGDAVDNIRAVAALYSESLQLVVKADSDIQSVDDLKGKRVSVGAEDSAVVHNAEQVFDAVGLKDKDMQLSYLSFLESAKAMENNKIDAFFVMAGAPTVSVEELAGQQKIRLISFSDETISRLIRQHPQYEKTTLPAGIYEGVEEDVNTISVKAVLTVQSGLSASVVEQITALLFEHSDELKYATPTECGPETGFATANVACPFHEGALSYYASQGVTVTDNSAASSAETK